jgi:hypothetical protein
MADTPHDDHSTAQISPKLGRKQTARAERTDRLTEELRANLKKRKSQARSRDTSPEITPGIVTESGHGSSNT